ncbi:MAG TPA: hypothetical protein VFQ39_05565 [Longimicrobium sp.]|nr:hypothetical protein [Longimicrobium sp.]
MAERGPDPSIDRIRDYARAKVARTSLRKVAKAAGVKVGATKKFIDGSVPYERNARLWKRWYARELREGMADAPDDALPTSEAVAVLELLLWSVPEEQRGAAQARIIESFRALHDELNRPQPLWVVELGGDGD